MEPQQLKYTYIHTYIQQEFFWILKLTIIHCHYRRKAAVSVVRHPGRKGWRLGLSYWAAWRYAQCFPSGGQLRSSRHHKSRRKADSACQVYVMQCNVCMCMYTWRGELTFIEYSTYIHTYTHKFKQTKKSNPMWQAASWPNYCAYNVCMYVCMYKSCLYYISEYFFFLLFNYFKGSHRVL